MFRGERKRRAQISPLGLYQNCTQSVRIYGRDVPVHVAGKLDDMQPSGSIVALTKSRVAPGPAEIGREAWTIIDAEAWGDGWDRLALSLS